VPRPCPVLRRWARDADLPVGSLPGRAANRAGRARHGIWWRAEYSNAGSGEREVDAVGRFGRTVAAALVCRWTLHRDTESGKKQVCLYDCKLQKWPLADANFPSALRWSPGGDALYFQDTDGIRYRESRRRRCRRSEIALRIFLPTQSGLNSSPPPAIYLPATGLIGRFRVRHRRAIGAQRKAATD
jgi:hypothetical protein